MELRLYSEYGTLQAVITHRPGHEIERLTPYNTSELLFEDVPYLEVMQQEHDEFTQLIRNTTGAQVLRFHDLLTDVLLDETLRLEVLRQALGAAGLSHRAEDILPRYSTSEVTTLLMAGIRLKELQRKYALPEAGNFRGTDYLIPPSPNLYFMRDPAAVVQEGVICSAMKFSGRQRESNLIRLVFRHHPAFRDHFRQVYPTPGQTGQVPTIEGGDVVVLTPHALAIGCSERTERAAIEALAEHLFRSGWLERIYEVDLPPKRNFMHLDTVFTIIDENLVVTYPDAMDSVLKTSVYLFDGLDNDGTPKWHREELNESIITVLKREIPYLEVIETGDGNPDYSSREQWYDGANVLAIAPRRVISYDRNKFTNRALREAGVEVLETSSSELSRGLGGPRCMTMPLSRRSFA
jgi:arginine deiminase